ncbi:hypothetical protein C8J57DRAFT_345144 [Mycena rebaudengoi]|nr:hypothetical protein C8J57DRAFT_345144 [Mycena rebaudengoi]
MAHRPSSTLHLPLADHDVSRMPVSNSQDWLANLILSAKAMAAGAELIPVPCIRAAFTTVVILLETIDKIKRNRDDLKELCETTVEIVLILRDEIAAHGETGAVRFITLCENFISFIQNVHVGLEKLQQSRHGLRGKLREILRASRISDQIEGYRRRVNELRSNFMLLTTIETNLNVITSQKRGNILQMAQFPPNAGQFRHIVLGDINLLYECALTSRVYKIKVFTARISGQTSPMTVVKYENEEAVGTFIIHT